MGILNTLGVIYDFAVIYVTVFLPMRNVYAFVLCRSLIHITSLHFLYFFQHKWEMRITEEEVNQNWGQLNAVTSYSLAGQSIPWHPLMIGNNGTNPSTLAYHLEHTLFPGINYMHLPEVAKICRQYFKEKNVPYHQINGFFRKGGAIDHWVSHLQRFGLRETEDLKSN